MSRKTKPDDFQTPINLKEEEEETKISRLGRQRERKLKGGFQDLFIMGKSKSTDRRSDLKQS